MDEPARHALLVSSSRYSDPSLRPLTSPTDDVDALAELLRHPTVGGFRVRPVIDQPSWVVAKEVERFFVERRLSDIALFYFSGHGIKDDDGRLYFAAMDTEPQLLRSTAVPSDHMLAAMSRCRSRQQVVLLDCCYAGAISKSMFSKGDDRAGVPERFASEGSGRVIIAASDSIQVAFEGGQISGEPALSVFTNALVEGIQTGEADQDGDGRVTLDELYDYVYDRVRQRDPNQTPTTSNLEKKGDIVIAINLRPREGGEEAPRPVAETATTASPFPPPKPARESRDEAPPDGLEPARATPGAGAHAPPHDDFRDQQRAVLSEFERRISYRKRELDVIRGYLTRDEALLAVSKVAIISPIVIGPEATGLLAVTSRRLVWVVEMLKMKTRELTYDQIISAEAKSDLLFWFGKGKLAVSAVPEGVEFRDLSEEPETLAALINERAQGGR
jgi:Caspase domain